MIARIVDAIISAKNKGQALALAGALGVVAFMAVRVADHELRLAKAEAVSVILAPAFLVAQGDIQRLDKIIALQVERDRLNEERAKLRDDVQAAIRADVQEMKLLVRSLR